MGKYSKPAACEKRSLDWVKNNWAGWVQDQVLQGDVGWRFLSE